MNIVYKVKSHAGVLKKKGSLGEFFESFNFLFRAKTIPPYSVVSDLCANSPEDWGGTNRIVWEKFKLKVEDYNEFLLWATAKGYAEGSIPPEIDTAYKWSLWQFQEIDGIPYEEHKKVTDFELKCIEELRDAKKTRDKNLIEKKEACLHNAVVSRTVYFNRFF